MTTRDRLALIGISTLAVLALVWLMLVSPERKEAAKLSSQVATAQAALAAAQGQASSARAAQARYSAAYASVVSLGKAVPPSQEVPSLIYQLAQASDQKHVEFTSITAGSGGVSGAGGAAGSSSAGAAGASSASAAQAASTAGFTQMPFTFVFNGSFTDLYHLFQQLDGATVRTASGGLHVSGRLLTLQGVKLEPALASAGGSSSGKLTGTITASAYVLPASEGLTGGATPSTPAASATSTAATSASSGGSPAAPVATVGAAR
jgi:hypothetical protein